MSIGDGIATVGGFAFMALVLWLSIREYRE